MNRLLPILIFILLSQIGFGQYYEVGAFVGASNYKGDLNDATALVPHEYNHALGVSVRYNAYRYFSIKANLFKGQISGDDANSNFVETQMRNLDFRANIVEFSTQFEFNLLPYAIREDKISAPYLFVGAGGMYFNPQAQMRGNWYDLQPLGTEGQGHPGLSDETLYSKFQVVIPMGLGFKFSLNEKINLGFEFGARRTFTDYLDDVSGFYPDLEALAQVNPRAAELSYRTPEQMQMNLPNPTGQERGNPDDKDWYYFMGFTVSVNMTDKYGLDFDEKYDVFKSENRPPTKAELKALARKKRKKRRNRTWKKIKKGKKVDDIKGLGF